jgi:hypothetical protein
MINHDGNRCDDACFWRNDGRISHNCTRFCHFCRTSMSQFQSCVYVLLVLWLCRIASRLISQLFLLSLSVHPDIQESGIAKRIRLVRKRIKDPKVNSLASEIFDNYTRFVDASTEEEARASEITKPAPIPTAAAPDPVAQESAITTTTTTEPSAAVTPTATPDTTTAEVDDGATATATATATASATDDERDTMTVDEPAAVANQPEDVVVQDMVVQDMVVQDMVVTQTSTTAATNIPEPAAAATAMELATQVAQAAVQAQLEAANVVATSNPAIANS